MSAEPLPTLPGRERLLGVLASPRNTLFAIATAEEQNGIYLPRVDQEMAAEYRAVLAQIEAKQNASLYRIIQRQGEGNYHDPLSIDSNFDAWDYPNTRLFIPGHQQGRIRFAPSRFVEAYDPYNFLTGLLTRPASNSELAEPYTAITYLHRPQKSEEPATVRRLVMENALATTLQNVLIKEVFDPASRFNSENPFPESKAEANN